MRNTLAMSWGLLLAAIAAAAALATLTDNEVARILIFVLAGLALASVPLLHRSGRRRIAYAVAACLVISAVTISVASGGDSSDDGHNAQTPVPRQQTPSAQPSKQGPSAGASRHPSGTPSTPGPSPTPTPPRTQKPKRHPSGGLTIPNPPVRHHGRLVLLDGNFSLDTDLDAPQSDPSWGNHSATGDGNGDAPQISGGEMTTGREAVPMALVKTGPANYAACSAREGLAGNTVEIGELRVGSKLCLETTAGRWAKLVVVAGPSGDSPSGNEIDLDVTVWDT